MIAHDLFAETNPAFVAHVAAAFIDGYMEDEPVGTPFILTYIAIPLALSGDLVRTFRGTNKATGLITWIERHPEIAIELGDRLNRSMSVVSEGIRLGCFVRLFEMTDDTRLITQTSVGTRIVRGLSSDTALVFRHAKRLGQWFSNAGQPKTVFDTMGLTT